MDCVPLVCAWSRNILAAILSFKHCESFAKSIAKASFLPYIMDGRRLPENYSIEKLKYMF